MVLKLRYSAPDGWREAKCRDSGVSRDNDPFFEDEEAAMSFCNGEKEGEMCPIRDKCLLFALTNNEKSGVWGGMSELGRRGLRKKWPLSGKEPREEWEWQTTESAVSGLDLAALLEDANSEED